MNIHMNARLTPKGRAKMISAVADDGLSFAQAAKKFHVSEPTIAKWVRRFRKFGLDGLRDRSSRPFSSPSRTDIATCAIVEELRFQRYTMDQIAAETELSRATVSRILKRIGLSLLACLEPKEPRPRYERETPGEIIHIDIKKLGKFDQPGHRVTGDRRRKTKKRKFPGWEYVHIAIDDHSRVAYSDIFPNEKAKSAVQHLIATVRYFKTFSVKIDRVMTDNGPCYKSGAFARACRRLGIKHLRTKPYTPQTNGKAERFVQTTIREWAYAMEYQTSEQRKADLPKWLHRYNWHRPHAALDKKPPISRIGQDLNNLLRLHS